jgi:mannose-6-phosphate isomerase-like protein (cupin superfamily)
VKRRYRMTVVRVGERPLTVDDRPAWCDVVGIGLFRIRPNSRFDRHFHDSPEYWLIYEGKAKVAVGDQTYYVQAGDVVCTPSGTEHDIVEIYEEMEGFYFEDPVPESGRIGRLHRDDTAAQGHPIPLVPSPTDFPSATRRGVIVS